MRAVTVSSVKGGTGKTLVAINLAYYLKVLTGKEVALVDLDIDSPNFAEFAGISDGRIEVDKNTKKFIPYVWNGIKVFSMSLVAEEDRPISMYGVMHQQVLLDILRNTEWGHIDYLVADCPAGASDLWKTAIDVLRDELVGGVVVTIPSTKVDARRVVKLHLLNDIPVIGLIENMAYFEDPESGKKYYVFGEPFGEKLCNEFGIEYLGQIPLSMEIGERVRSGNPVLPEKYADPIKRAVEKIKDAPKIGLATKVREAVSETIKGWIEKVIASFVIEANKSVDILSLQKKYGFTEKRPFDLVITDDKMEKVISRTHFKVEDGRLKVVQNPKRIDFEIVTSFRTLARMFAGKKKLRDGRIIPFDPMDAWLNNEILVYGNGAVPRGIYVVRHLLNEDVIAKLRTKYGKLLEKFI